MQTARLLMHAKEREMREMQEREREREKREKRERREKRGARKEREERRARGVEIERHWQATLFATDIEVDRWDVDQQPEARRVDELKRIEAREVGISAWTFGATTPPSR